MASKLNVNTLNSNTGKISVVGTDLLDLSNSTDGIILPSGPTSSEGTPENNAIRFDTTDNKLKVYPSVGGWKEVIDASSVFANRKISIVGNGLILYLDAGNSSSYPGSGTTWTDLSGQGNNGTLVNGVGYDSANGGSLSFDGVDDYIQLPNSLGYSTEVSAFAWFRSTGSPVGGYHIIIGGVELEISIHSSGYLRTGVYTDIRYVSNHGSGLVDGNWHQVGFTFSGTTKTSYIDGISVGTQTTAGALTSSFSDRTMGKYGSSNTYYLNGDISIAQIYNRTLTPQEIQKNYNILEGRFQ